MRRAMGPPGGFGEPWRHGKEHGLGRRGSGNGSLRGAVGASPSGGGVRPRRWRLQPVAIGRQPLVEGRWQAVARMARQSVRASVARHSVGTERWAVGAPPVGGRTCRSEGSARAALTMVSKSRYLIKAGPARPGPARPTARYLVLIITKVGAHQCNSVLVQSVAFPLRVRGRHECGCWHSRASSTGTGLRRHLST